MKLICQFYGGDRNRQTLDLRVARSLTDTRSRDWSAERSAGRLCPRAELDNQPTFSGYLGHMWDGIRYEINGKMVYDFEAKHMNVDVDGLEPIGVLRYETKEVYNFLSN